MRFIDYSLCMARWVTILSIGLAVHTANAQSVQPGQVGRPVSHEDTSQLHPVEPTVADRGPLTMPMRQMPLDLALPQGFDRVYQVPGDSGMFYRANGALYAVFDEGLYQKSKDVQRMTLAPAGVVYYIGKPDWRSIKGPSQFQAGSVMHETQRKNLAAEKVAMTNDEIDDSQSRKPEAESEPAAPPAPTEYAPTAADVAAWASQLPAGVDKSLIVGTGADVRPRLVADFFYRQERLSSIFRWAVNAKLPS